LVKCRARTGTDLQICPGAPGGTAQPSAVCCIPAGCGVTARYERSARGEGFDGGSRDISSPNLAEERSGVCRRRARLSGFASL